MFCSKTCDNFVIFDITFCVIQNYIILQISSLLFDRLNSTRRVIKIEFDVTGWLYIYTYTYIMSLINVAS